MVATVTEAAAKAFFEAGVNLKRPASIRIDHSRTPWVRNFKQKWCPTFMRFSDARLKQTVDGSGYYRKKKTRKTLRGYATKEEAMARLYRDVYEHVHGGLPDEVQRRQQSQQQERALRDQRAAASRLRRDPEAALQAARKLDEQKNREVRECLLGRNNQKRKATQRQRGRDPEGRAAEKEEAKKEALEQQRKIMRKRGPEARHAAASAQLVTAADERIKGFREKMERVLGAWDQLHATCSDYEAGPSPGAGAGTGGASATTDTDTDDHTDDAPASPGGGADAEAPVTCPRARTRSPQPTLE